MNEYPTIQDLSERAKLIARAGVRAFPCAICGKKDCDHPIEYRRELTDFEKLGEAIENLKFEVKKSFSEDLKRIKKFFSR